MKTINPNIEIDLLIKKSGFKKSHVAENVGISTSTLSRIISGKQSYVSDETLLKIKKFLIKS